MQAWQASTNAEVATAEAQSRYADMQTRTNIAFSEMRISEFNSRLQHAIARAQLAMESSKAIGQFTAQLVAGAMSAINVSAGVSGTGSQSGAWNRNDNYSYEGN